MRTKKFLCTISLILSFVSVFSIASCALTTGIVNGSGGNMNMRDGPGTTHKIIVTVPNKTPVVINDLKKCDDNSTSASWYNVTCKVNGVEYTGYISSVGISNVTTDSSTGGYTEGVSELIPDTYLTYINQLKEKHPNWSFKFFYTGLDWYDVIKNETKAKVNSIEGSSYPISYRSTSVYFSANADYVPSDSNIGIINGTDGSLNMRTGPGISHSLIIALDNGTRVIILDTVPCDDNSTRSDWYKISVTVGGKTYTGYVSANRVSDASSSGSYSFTPVEGSNWYQAHGQVVSHFIDPRNFLNENNIFQFEELTYNSSVQTIKGVQAILKGSFMDNVKIKTDDGRSITYAEAFMEAGKKSNVSPYHLASKVLQEVGKNGSKSTSGTNPNYPVYNFYNIGANTGYLDGLKWAYNNGESGTYGRPWTTQYKSIIGGAEFISSGYISKGQNTIYLEKFDFIPEGGLYQHQYAADVTYSYVQAKKIYSSVYSGILSTDFCFVIPVFRNMPRNVCALPKSSSQPNMAPDCPVLTDTVDPKPTSSTGNVTPSPNPEPTPNPNPNPNIPIVTVPNEHCGDLNGDEKISVVDTKYVLQNIAGLRKFSDDQKIYADINCDGKITVIDAKWLLQIIAGLRDMKVETGNSQATTNIESNLYAFSMPNDWEYSIESQSFFKKNTDSKCFVKIDDVGTQNNDLNYTLDLFFKQSYDYAVELANDVNNDNTKNSAVVKDGEFTLKSGGNTVKYFHYLEYDENKKIIDSQYIACLLIGDEIFNVEYFCTDGVGFDSEFDFSKQLSENFVIK